MSTRTRINRNNNPGAAAVHKPARFDRRTEHRRVRRATQVELRQLVEPEDLALPRPVHTGTKIDPSERPEPGVKRRRFRVWKTKSWKRRSLNRSARAAAYEEFLKEEV